MFITGIIIRLCSNPKVTQLSSRHRRKFLEIKSFSCFNSDSNFGLYRKYHRSITNEEVKHKRIELYDKEVKRQNALITDIEKIEVRYEGFPENCTLIMNKGLSTPFNCAQHLHKLIMDRSALAEVDGDIWDLFRPLTHNCTLRFLHFKEADPFYVNKAFWRSMSLMLGAVLENSFNIDYYVQLCSFPPPKVRTGSFVYDIGLPLESWKPNKDEMRVLSTQMVRLSLENKPFQRLEVDAKLALRMFEDNMYKREQIPHIAAQSESGNTVTLYRIEDYVDISRGPCISHTGHMGKCTITAVHPLPLDAQYGTMYRVQGVALPKDFHINHYSYSILEERARRMNSGPLPYIASFHEDEAEERTL
ncbi:UNVERIFIED_CONTAM: hypothetical protein RMT77_016089 [Armadillidium vulgare]